MSRNAWRAVKESVHVALSLLIAVLSYWQMVLLDCPRWPSSEI